jgi:hypothetical protein
MLTLIRALYRAICAGDDTAVGIAYWALRQHVGRERAQAIARRLALRADALGVIRG